MPILPIALQRRHAELGRIRLGAKGDRGQPQKLERFRFTSPHERHIRDLAQLYGGDARAWRNGNREEWEVHSDAVSIPVIVVRGGVSQWLETWTGGGCTRRCDGERETLQDVPCICETESRDRVCKPTTRLSVMLRDLDAIGVWRLESHGWNAAAELPGMVELAQHVADLVPARLMLSERVTVRDGRTSRFVVPGLDLEVAPSRLAALVAGGAPQVSAPVAPAAVEARAEVPDYALAGERTDDVEVLRRVYAAARDAGHMTAGLHEALTARAEVLKGTVAPTSQGPVGDPQGDVDGVWMEVLATAGRLDPPLNSAELESRYAQVMGGQIVTDADASQLREFLAHLRGAGVAA